MCNPNTCLGRFSECCDELRSLYTQELDFIYNRCADFQNKYSFLQAQSVLSVIDKIWMEDYHSKLIKYVWEHENGGEILTHFLKTIGVEGEWLGSVQQQHYRVETEHTIKNQKRKSWNGKRIDLLICDDVNKWLVVIENKVLSSVRYSTPTKTQLEVYRGYCEGNREWDGYSKVYILLDYKECGQGDGWNLATYMDVFISILKNKTDDNVVEDYLRTLYSMLSPISDTSSDIRSLEDARMFYNEIILHI